MIFLKSIQSKKQDLVILYYLLLGIIQAMWTNMSAFPPLPFRLLMIGAVVLPMVLKKEYIVFGVPFFMILRGQLATDYQYMPDVHSYGIYTVLLIGLLIIHRRTVTLKYLKVFTPMIILLVYMWIIDILGINQCGEYVHNLLIAILYSLFLTSEKDVHVLSFSLISACALLSVYYILMYNQFLEVWNKLEGIERSGWNDPNYFSTLLGVGFLLSALYVLGYIKTEMILCNRKLLILTMIAIFLAVVLTASRAGYIATSSILIFTIIKSRPNILKLLSTTCIIVLCVLIMYRCGIFDTLLYRLLEQGNLDTGGGRTDIWVRFIQNYKDQSYLNQIFGCGYWYRVQLSGGADMHNEFIAIWADYGFIGLVFYLLLIFSMLLHYDKTFNIRIIAVVYYILMVVSLSPFQYVNVGFFIVWVLSVRLIACRQDII